MRLVGESGTAYVVTDVGYDVAAGRDSLHLRRIRPLPPVESNPRPSDAMAVVALDDISTARDGLAQLAARAAPKVLGVWTAFNSRTEFKEYQFRPLLKYLKSPTRRILVADEVGLGKTIEAAYVIVEELGSGLAKRILILCPAGLRLKWRDELWNRFGLNFQITNGKGLIQLLTSRGPFMAIVSYDSAWKEGDLKAGGATTPIDLLVVDEVHNLIGRGGETQRRTMAFEISGLSSACVALSATPIHLEIDDLRRVLEVTFGKPIGRTAFAEDSMKAGIANRLIEELESDSALRPTSIGDVESLLKAGDDDAMASLMSLGNDPSDRDAKASVALALGRSNPFEALMTRTRKSEVGAIIPRHVHNHSIPLDEDVRAGQQDGSRTSERSLYTEIDGLLEQSFSHVHRLQLSSCMPAMVDLLKVGMKGFNVWQEGERVESELSVMDQGDQEKFQRMEGRLPPEARKSCSELADKFGLVRTDSKLACLRLLLGSLDDKRKDGKSHKAIIFTQWRHTWAYLTRRLEGTRGIRLFALSGDDDPRKVATTLREFEAYDRPALLISTDFLSEGLDLQPADILINYDFPYNPQRVEQRIGRIDRIGQIAPEITIHNVVVSGSLDEQMLDVLRVRLDIFKEGMGDKPAIFESRAGRISEAESRMAQRRRSASEKALQEAQPFKGVESLLDEETRRIRSTRSGDFGRFGWASVIRMLSVFSGGRARIVEETPEHLKVGPIDDQDIQAVCDAVGMTWAGKVREEILAERDEASILRIAKIPTADGMFLPPLHPLVRRALRVTLNSFGGEEGGVPPLCLRMDSLPADYLAIFDYTHGRTHSTLAYWWRSGNREEKVTGEGLSKVIESLESCELKTTEPVELPSELLQKVQLDYDEWRNSLPPEHLQAGEEGEALEGGVEHIATIYPG